MNPFNRLVLATEMLEITAKSRKKRKAKSGPGAERSAMLRVIMPSLSSTNGDNLIKAFNNQNIQLFEKTWETIKGQIIKKAFPDLKK